MQKYSTENSTHNSRKRPSKWNSLKERKTVIKASLQQDALTLPSLLPATPAIHLQLGPSHSLSPFLSPFDVPHLHLSIKEQTRLAAGMPREFLAENIIVLGIIECLIKIARVYCLKHVRSDFISRPKITPNHLKVFTKIGNEQTENSIRYLNDALIYIR